MGLQNSFEQFDEPTVPAVLLPLIVAAESSPEGPPRAALSFFGLCKKWLDQTERQRIARNGHLGLYSPHGFQPGFQWQVKRHRSTGDGVKAIAQIEALGFIVLGIDD